MSARLPLGFRDFEQLARFSHELAAAMADDGAAGEAFVIGTAATGWSLDMRRPEPTAFDARGAGTSDVDVVLRSIGLLGTMMRTPGAGPDRDAVFLGKYIWLANDGAGGFLTRCPALAAWARTWSVELGRPVDLRLLLSAPGDPCELLDLMEPGPIALA